jgi:hypothetical protein
MLRLCGDTVEDIVTELHVHSTRTRIRLMQSSVRISGSGSEVKKHRAGTDQKREDQALPTRWLEIWRDVASGVCQ